MVISNTPWKLVFTSVLGLAAMPAKALESYFPTAPMSEPKVTIPPPQGIAGCWTSDDRLYGDYRLSFCVQSYSATYTTARRVSVGKRVGVPTGSPTRRTSVARV